MLTRRTLLAALAAPRPDVVVYGGTPSGVMAAIAAVRAGAKVTLIAEDRFVGGMAANGSCFVEESLRPLAAGLAREFLVSLGKRYNEPIAWAWEPHAAEAGLTAMLKDAGVTPALRAKLRDSDAASVRGNRVQACFTADGREFKGGFFIDASLDGALLAAARTATATGREPFTTYNEPLAGVRRKLTVQQFDVPVFGLDAANGLLPEVFPVVPGNEGDGDEKLEAPAYRLVLSRNDRNRVPVRKPARYNGWRYAILVRWLESFLKQKKRPAAAADLFRITPLPNNKAVFDAAAPFSLDAIGRGWNLLTAEREALAEIQQDLIDYGQGLIYFLASEPATPTPLREEIASWGLPADEFGFTNNWPALLWQRDTRRLKNDAPLTQFDLTTRTAKPDAVCRAAGPIRLAHTQRFLGVAANLENEGAREIPCGVFEIPFAALVPRERANLLATYCAAASWLAAPALRTELTAMHLGEAAGLAAAGASNEMIRARLMP